MGIIGWLSRRDRHSEEDDTVHNLCMKGEALLVQAESQFLRGDCQSAFWTYHELVTCIAEINTRMQAATRIREPTLKRTQQLKAAIVERFVYYHDKGAEASNSKEYEKARAYLGVATALETGTTFHAAFKLANVFSFSRDYPRCREILNGIISSDPGNSRAWREVGWTHVCEQDYGKGIESLKKAIEANEQDGTAHYFMALCYAAIEDVNTARMYAERARRLGVDAAHEATYRQNLAELDL